MDLRKRKRISTGLALELNVKRKENVSAVSFQNVLNGQNQQDESKGRGETHLNSLYDIQAIDDGPFKKVTMIEINKTERGMENLK